MIFSCFQNHWEWGEGKESSRLSFQEKCLNHTVELVWRWNCHCSSWELNGRNLSPLPAPPPQGSGLVSLPLPVSVKGCPLAEPAFSCWSLSHFWNKILCGCIYRQSKVTGLHSGFRRCWEFELWLHWGGRSDVVGMFSNAERIGKDTGNVPYRQCLQKALGKFKVLEQKV
jgi:hypothetical protein